MPIASLLGSQDASPEETVADPATGIAPEAVDEMLEHLPADPLLPGSKRPRALNALSSADASAPSLDSMGTPSFDDDLMAIPQDAIGGMPTIEVASQPVLPLDETLKAAHEKFVGTAAMNVTGDLAEATNQISTAIESIPGLDPEMAKFAINLMRRCSASALAVNPGTMGVDESAMQIRVAALNDAGSRFLNAWASVASGFDQKYASPVNDVAQLVQNVLGAHSQRLTVSMETMRARQAMNQAGMAPAAGGLSALPNTLARAVSGLWDMGVGAVSGTASVITKVAEMRRARRKDSFAPELAGGEGLAGKIDPVDEPVADLVKWRERKLGERLDEAERLATELNTKAGDRDWEDSRGLELLGDLERALEEIQTMSKEDAIDPTIMGSLSDRLDHIRNTSDNAADKAAGDSFKDRIRDVATKLAEFVNEIVDKIKNLFVNTPAPLDATPPAAPANEPPKPEIARSRPQMR